MVNEKRQVKQDQGNMTYRFHDKVFASKRECVDTLLQEAEAIITQIDNGHYENNRLNRNFASWRLDHISKYIEENNLQEHKNTCNNLWSQLYRFEHSQSDYHPYVKKIRIKIMGL